MEKQFLRMIWNDVARGELVSTRCKIAALRADTGYADGNHFDLPPMTALTVELTEITGGIGAEKSLLKIAAENGTFTLQISDVSKEHPIYIPAYGVVVTTGDDGRSFDEITAALKAEKFLSVRAKMDEAPEESFENAAAHTIKQRCPTWLGVSRDIRLFEIGYRNQRLHGFWPMETVDIKQHFQMLRRIAYQVGRGIGCTDPYERSLEKGYLPIVNSRITDGSVQYDSQMFASLQYSPLTPDTLEGTHYLLANGNCIGGNYTPAQQEEIDRLKEDYGKNLNTAETTVLYLQITMRNIADTPKYGWMRIPQPAMGKSAFDREKACVRYIPAEGEETPANTVCVTVMADSAPVEQTEIALLLQPGEEKIFRFAVPHRMLTDEESAVLRLRSYPELLAECIKFWETKYEALPEISLPEKRIEEMMKAGLFHLDLICYGGRDQDTVAPCTGVYTPIGSESSPIIQYLDLCGNHELALRALRFFYKKQHEDGLMQNFGGYMLENGAVLWTTYLHMAYSGATDWIPELLEGILKSVSYLRAWISRNEREELRGKGYGMIDGKVADPEDPYHAYMLNAYAYAGLLGASRLLEAVGHEEASALRDDIKKLRKNILETFEESIQNAPVVPLGDGTWCPSIPPWPESQGPMSMFVNGGTAYTHGSIVLRDSLLGAMYLLYFGIIPSDHLYADFILDSFCEHYFERNVAFSQPYYSPHPFLHLERNEKKRFLTEFYNGVAGLADRETYTFWEHHCGVSVHKTHEEAWFLLRCRQLLCREARTAGDRPMIELLKGVPDAWLRQGEAISWKQAPTEYGKISFSARQNRSLLEIEIDFAPHTAADVAVYFPAHANIGEFRYEGGSETAIRGNAVILRDARGKHTLQVPGF